jgi:N-hydroxyarylamine O-acetyltransferase
MKPAIEPAQINQYLARIGIGSGNGNPNDIAQQAEPTLAFLAHLQMQHLLTVPFENFSVIQGEPIHLAAPALFDKIVRRGRGGFCYELNGLFAELLTALNFRITRVSAQVHQSATGSYGPPFDHLALLVQLDELYLVDVGFGDSSRKPIRLPNGKSSVSESLDTSGQYRLRAAEPAEKPANNLTNQEAYILERHENAAWEPQFIFSTTPYSLHDFAEMCHYHTHAKSSGFTRRLTCSRATPSGRFTLSNDQLIITRNEQKTRTTIVQTTQRDRILRAYFGVTMNKEVTG